MDMKRILQAMDGVATQPVKGASDMSKFLSIVDKNDVSIIKEEVNNNTVLNEGANPHKVTLPVQMAMQHYQQPAESKAIRKPSLLNKYFKEVELELEEEKTNKRQLINQYASTIAQKVLIKESKSKKLDENEISGHSMGFTGGVGPGLQSNEPVEESPIEMDPADPNNPMIHSHEKANPMHLKGRIMQARAQLKELAELANSNELVAWEKICKLAKGGMFMGLEQNLEQIRHGIDELASKRRKGGIASRGIDTNIGEAVLPTIKASTPKQIKPKKKTSSCRAGQVQTGMQTKDGKLVPKCSIK